MTLLGTEDGGTLLTLRHENLPSRVAARRPRRRLEHVPAAARSARRGRGPRSRPARLRTDGLDARAKPARGAGIRGSGSAAGADGAPGARPWPALPALGGRRDPPRVAVVLSCQWSRIAEEEAFPGRCAEAGDELGSAVVTARLARELMRLWLLMHRRYPPYSKWLGSAFAQVPGGAGLGRHLAAALAAPAGPPGSGNSSGRTGSPPRRTTGSASPNPSTPAPGPTTTGRTRSSTPGASPPPCPPRSPIR